MDIIKIIGCLNATGFHIKREIFNATEQKLGSLNNNYNEVYNIDEALTIIKKDELNTPKETAVRNGHKTISFVIWCLPGNEAKCEKLLKTKIIDTATQIMNEANLMFAQINSLKNEKR
jgi:hypothetical protein